MSFDFLEKLKTKLGLLLASESELEDEDKTYDSIVKQLHRIKGQVVGIERMYQDKRGCADIVYQIMAVKSSLDSVAKELLTNEVVACSREGNLKEIERLMKELVKNN